MKTKQMKTLSLFVLQLKSLKTIIWILFLLPLGSGQTFSQNTWVQKANFQATPRYAATGFSIGTKGYIGTGWDGKRRMDFWEWDQATNVWTQKADCGVAGRTSAVGFSVGNKGYIGTGLMDIGEQQDLWEYDQASNIWTQKANFGGTPRQSAVGFSIGTKGYIGTGSSGSSSAPKKDFWEWDQATNAWTQKADFGGNGKLAAVGFSVGTKGYIGTGLESSYYTSTRDFWEWDQASNVWTQKADFGGTARYSAVGFSIGSKGYIGTGEDGSGAGTEDFWEWDQTANVWTQRADVGGGPRYWAVGFSIGNKGYIGTGDSHAYIKNVYNDFWEYTPSLCSINAAISSDPAPNTTFCVGQNVYLAASGGTSYAWGTGDTGANIAATLSVTTTYSVTVSDAAGCTGTASIIFVVDPNCTTTGISQIYSNVLQMSIWPNPSGGEFTINDLGSGIYNLDLYNVMGEKAYSEKIHNPQPVVSGAESSQIINLDLPNGVYYLRVKTDASTGSGGTITQKLIINK